MKKTKLVAAVSCGILVYSGFTVLAGAEETAKVDDAAVDEVIVTSTKLNPLKIPVKMAVVTADDIKAKGAQTAADALKDVAGVYVTGGNSKGKSYGQIRGSDAYNTKVIVDGVELTSVGDNRVDLSLIPTDNIEKIEVIKGPVPVIYGTNAPGGVIFISTKNGGRGSSGSVSIAGGSWETERYTASLSGDTGKVNYYFGLKEEGTDGYTTHAGRKSEYYNGKLRFNFNPQASLTVFGSYLNENEQFPNRYDANGNMLGYPGQGGALTAANSYLGGGNTYGTTYNWAYAPIKTQYLGAVYDQKLNGGSDISLKVYQSSQQSLLTTEGLTAGQGYQQVDWDGTVNGYELQHTIRTSRANTATWGYSYETRGFTELTPNRPPAVTYNRGDYDYTGKSYYIQDVFKANSRLAASIGYRHNDIDDGIILNTSAYTPGNSNLRNHHTSDDPVVTLNYQLSGRLAVHGSIGKSFRTPNAMEVSSPGGSYAPLGITASPYLLPESAINREAGVTYAAKSGFNADVTLFSRNITNMIKGGGGGGGSGGGAGGGHTTYYNIPDVEMHGFETEINKKFGDHLKGFVNFSYTNAYDTRARMQVSDIPYRKFSYGFNYAGKGGLNANLAVCYVGAVRSMFSQGNGNGEEDGNDRVDYTGTPGGWNSWKTQHLPGYHVVDLKVSKAVNNTEYYIKVLNLLDEKYYQGAYLIAPGRYVELGSTTRF